MTATAQHLTYPARESEVILDWSVPQWEREKPRGFWDPSRKLIKSIRDYQRYRSTPGPFSPLMSKWCVLRHRFWTVITGAEIDLGCQIGGGLLIPHPNGIVIHPKTKIGPNCLIFQQVTLAGGPVLGHHVDIGAGAKILGKVELGHHSRVGANAVVTKNVRSSTTVVGIPARPI